MRIFRAISMVIIIIILLASQIVHASAAAVLTHAQVTIKGTFYYDDRLGNRVVAPFMTINLYDHSPTWGDTPLTQVGSLFTDANGYFSFSTENWNYLEGRHLNVVAEWVTEYPDSATSERRVVKMSWETYKFRSETKNDVQDYSIVDVSSVWPTGYGNLQAIWIFQDLRRSWQFVYNNTYPHIDPGRATARWESGVPGIPGCGGNGSCFFVISNHEPFAFISDPDAVSSDIVIHEAAHYYVYNLTQWWLFYDTGCWQHYIFSTQSTTCAYYEGWADFLPLAVNNDPCFDKLTGPCSGTADSDNGYYNLETHSRSDNLPKGDTVEGRVAGTLYDFFDPVNDDTANFGFSSVATVALHSPAVTVFSDYWNQWKVTIPNDKHDAVKAIYLNSIEGGGYDTPPSISVPSVVALKNGNWIHWVDLRVYASDPESDPSQLDYLILNNSGQQCGVTLVDTYWLNIVPPYNFQGQCNVTVRVSDGVKTGSSTFTVNIVPGIYIPLLLK